LTAAIKLLQAKQRKYMYQAASRAVDRALAAANDALGDSDPDEIEELRQQLSAKLREMEAAAAYVSGWRPTFTRRREAARGREVIEKVG
jgi:uncharacterized protein YicC (UPF0701 family)